MTATAGQPLDAAHRFPALLAKGRNRAREIGRQVLVSVAEPIHPADPLEVLAAVERDELSTDRMYWAVPSQGFAIAGLGAVVTFSPRGAARFSAADRGWASLMADALVDDASGGTPGVGPLALGGFAFDEEGPHTERWSGFPAALLFVPRVLLTATPTGCWLTMNVSVGADGMPDVDLGALDRLRARVLATRPRQHRRSSDPLESPVAYTDVLPPDEWRDLVRDAVGDIRAGSLEKVVVAREVRAAAPRPIDILAALRHLRATHADCYVFGLWRGDSIFVGASPERLVRVDGRDVRASTLAGSIRRGADPAEDRALAARLLASDKDRSEHEVVRRAMYQTLEQVSDDVIADAEPSLLTLPQVHHLHTAVRARLRPGHSALDLVARLHPTPAVGGAPRQAALRFLRDHERLDRGWYAAPVGWLQRDAAEFAVALRSALVRGTEASLFAGCGIVADSDPAREFAESELKLVPMELAIAAAVGDAAAADAAESAVASGR